DDQRRRLLRVPCSGDEERVRHVRIRFGEVIRALPDALLRCGERRLGGAWNAVEAARDVGRGDARERSAVVIDVRRAGARVGVFLRELCAGLAGRSLRGGGRNQQEGERKAFHRTSDQGYYPFVVIQ